MTTAVPPTAEPTAWYSVPAAARHLGISERAVRKRVESGSIRAQRDGTRWLVQVPPGTSDGTATTADVDPESGTAVVGGTPDATTAPRNHRYRAAEPAVPETRAAEQLAMVVERAIERATTPLFTELADQRRELSDVRNQLVAVVDRAARAEADRDHLVKMVASLESDPKAEPFPYRFVLVAFVVTLLIAGAGATFYLGHVGG